MKESDRGMFENEWENAFEGAEMAPSESVWSKVEAGVANNEGKNYKRSLLFFKLLAAASVSFAMSIGGWQLYDNYYNDVSTMELSAQESLKENKELEEGDKSNSSLLSERTESSSSADASNMLSQALAESKKVEVGEKDDLKATTDNTDKTDSSHPSETFRNRTNADQGLATMEPRKNDFESATAYGNNESASSPFNNQSAAASPDKLEYLGIDFFAAEGNRAEPKMVPWLSNINTAKKDDFKGLWAGVGMSAGSFNSGSSSDASMAMSEGFLNSDVGSVSDAPSIDPDASNGNAYSFGLSVGTQISKRIVLMSGLSYVQQSTTSNSNIVALNTTGYSAVDRSNALSSEASYAYTDAYKISNTYELLSVPVQAGYILLDRKFNILLLSGVYNDIFLRQKISDESGRASSVENTGSDSGYSIYSLSGLIGSEFSYDIGQNYSLSLQPQLRQTLSSFTPEGSKPTFFEVGFKFKYIIK